MNQYLAERRRQRARAVSPLVRAATYITFECNLNACTLLANGALHNTLIYYK